MAIINSPTQLISASHYHQVEGRHPKPLTIDPHCEKVELVTGGRGWIQHDNTLVEVTPGTLIWLIPGDKTISRSDFKNPYRCLAVTFETPNIAEYRVPKISQWSSLEAVAAFTNEVVKLFVDETFDRDILCQYAFQRLLFQATRSHHAETQQELHPGIRIALKLIHDNYSESLPMSVIAHRCNWSVAYLHEMFKKHLQTSPHRILMQRRIRAARELLISSNYPMKRIALECGFSHTAAFCQSFKKVTGETPGAYRFRHLN